MVVSADSLNFDVLELIFSFLSGQDLASAAQVNRSFLAGALPRLYKNVWYRLREGKGYSSGQVLSPFSVILQHPTLAVHVRNIDIETVPFTTTLGIKKQPHPTFMRECTKSMALCRNLMSFKCTIPNVLPSFLISLQNKSRLKTLRVYANLTMEQSRLLQKIATLEGLVLEFASWEMMHVLPSWTTTMRDSLRTLVLYMTNELNVETLDAVLEQVPELQSLHIIGCARVDHVAVLKALSHVTELESLSFTTTDSSTATIPIVSPTLASLHTVCIDARCTRPQSPMPTTLQNIVDFFQNSACQLSSFCVKLPERNVMIGHSFVIRLLNIYGASLKKVAFIDCGLENQSLSLIAKRCIRLERLDVAIPVKDLYLFAEMLGATKTLKTLVHVDNQHVHGPRPPITQENIEHILDRVGTLQTVVSDKRVWVRRDLKHGYVHAKIDRRLPAGPRSLWFLPSNKI
ncbi:hypothetical protein BKA70DRAFT_1100621 [Coprinopsis sp. MPI-PUGE-AT-0042]|nr:hypothetical protein BKA70DRAFT_1100621 [Coprinopsis sp. MPI-PUGE-AT-0042]